MAEQFGGLQNMPADAVAEAELLLEYAVKKGLDIDERLLTVIVKAKHSLKEEKWNDELEISFWNAYNYIAKKVQPVNIDSLKAISPPRTDKENRALAFFLKLRGSKADRAARYYQSVSYLILLLLVVIQIINSYGSSVVKDIELFAAKRDDTDLEYREKTNLLGDNAADDLEASRLNAQKKEYSDKLYASYEALNRWTDIFSPYHKVKQLDKPVYAMTSPEVARKEAREAQVTFQNAKVLLNMLQAYILPLIYGFLGACAYILRTLRNDIRNVTYTPASHISYLVRLQLGGLSGLVIGWFAKPQANGIVESISPFALAFIAGYSVELLFAAMDKIVFSFTGRTPQGSGKQDAAGKDSGTVADRTHTE